MNVDILRNLMGVLNRKNQKDRVNPKATENVYSPPHKGFVPRRASYSYPVQLSGLHGEARGQRVTLTGSANQGSSFRGAGGA